MLRLSYFEKMLISSPIATPTPLRLSPRQTSQPAFHFVPPKTFSRNKTHLKHHSVPLNRFIWDKTLRPAFFRAKRTWSCYRTDTHKLWKQKAIEKRWKITRFFTPFVAKMIIGVKKPHFYTEYPKAQHRHSWGRPSSSTSPLRRQKQGSSPCLSYICLSLTS